jgi:hypothetical protein
MLHCYKNSSCQRNINRDWPGCNRFSSLLKERLLQAIGRHWEKARNACANRGENKRLHYCLTSEFTYCDFVQLRQTS